jgi:hypothetical protein
LGFICFPVDLIHLQVQKPASADLHNSQFIKDWGEIDLKFFPELFDAGARVRHPTGVHRALKRCFSSVFSARMRRSEHLSTQ